MKTTLSNHFVLLGAALSGLVASGCSHLGQTHSTVMPPESHRSAPAESVQLALARSAELRGETEEALAAYYQALRLNSELVVAYHRLALLHDRLGDSRKANALYREAVARTPHDPELHCDLGYNFYLLGMWADAEHHYRTALEIRPGLGRAHNNWALLLARQGRMVEAFDELARSGVSEADAHSNLGFALLLDGHLDAAIHHLRIADQLSHGESRTATELVSLATHLAQNNARNSRVTGITQANYESPPR